MKPDPTVIAELLEYARLAPSVHNAQPWRYVIKDDSVSIAVEPSRMLDAGDPTGRESWISFGICLEALLQAATGLGLVAVITYQQTEKLHDTIATVTLSSGDKKHPELLNLLQSRHTYREKMKPATIANELIEACRQNTADLKDVEIGVLTDKAAIKKVGGLTYKAMGLALGDPAFRDELYHYVHYNWSSSKTGLHGYAMGEGLLGSAFGKLSVKLGLGLGMKAKHDQKRIEDASALFFVTTKGDVPKYWFEAGRAYLRVALQITKRGLAQGTLAAPVEAASFHEDIERMLGTKNRIQSMIRVGGATHTPRRTSPRLDVSELT